MLTIDNVIIPPVSGIVDTTKVRVVLVANNRLVHAPLSDILKPYFDQIDALSQRLRRLETR